MTNPHSPWPADDDIDRQDDLPAATVANVIHEKPPESDAHRIREKVLMAHLDKLIGDLGDAIRIARTARESLGGDGA